MGLATTLCIIPLFVINMYASEVFNNPLATITSVLLRSFCTMYGTYMTWTLAQHLLRMPGMEWIKKTVVSPAWAVFKFGTFNARTAVLIDSRCTKLVFHNSDKLINLHKPDHNYVIHGVGGKLPVTLVCDFPVALKHVNGSVHVRLIKECLVAPNASTNLLATGDFRDAGISLHI